MGSIHTPSAMRSSGPIGPQSPNVSPIAKHIPQSFHSGYGHASTGASNPYTIAPHGERKSVERSPPKYAQKVDSGLGSGATDAIAPMMQTTQILLRRLPSSMSSEALISMLLFAEDFLDARFTGTEPAEDPGFLSAIARFRTLDGAYEARNKLHGRLNATNDAIMIVDVIQAGTTGSPGIRRNVSDGQSGRQLSTSTSSGGSAASNGYGSRQPSRYSGTFQTLEKISPSKHIPSQTIIEVPSSDSTASEHLFYSSHSPVITSSMDRPWISGKSVINDDIADEETGELLRDPLAFAKNGHVGNGQRQPSGHGVSNLRLANLHLNTDESTPSDGFLSKSGYVSTRPILSIQSPISEFSPTSQLNSMQPMSPAGMQPMSPTGTFHTSPQFQRPNYPPANPADQNPPCNTLYVGNLPVDTSEDELKAMFSKQRGYKRLCFRTKHNGPMCFVEFEDITFATKALNELYGQPLHNSIKGGIRLSFSKNPLGVRTGQGNGMLPQSPLTSPNGSSSFGNGLGCPPGFTTANGPPPGLAMPPGLSPPMNSMTSGLGREMSGFFNQSSPPLPSNPTQYPQRGQSFSNNNNGSVTNGFNHNSISNGFPDYMMGR